MMKSKHCLTCEKCMEKAPKMGFKDWAVKKFCSLKCRDIFRVGSNSTNWKGGIKIDKDGYVLIKSPNHPYRNKQNYVQEHRLVMEAYLGRYLLPAEFIDHKNRIKNDNRLENLRIATTAQNAMNRIKQPNNTSGFKGVYKANNCDRYYAQTNKNGKHIHLGLYKTAEEAALAYNEYAKKNHGEFARLNVVS